MPSEPRSLPLTLFQMGTRKDEASLEVWPHLCLHVTVLATKRETPD